MPSGLDPPINSVVTFLSVISSPPKIHSNPASPEETPAPALPSTSQPPTITPYVAPSASIRSQFSTSSPEASQSEKPKNFLHSILFILPFDPFYHGLITSNFNLITLLLDVNIAVKITQITHAEQNDPALFNIYNTVSNQISVYGKEFLG